MSNNDIREKFFELKSRKDLAELLEISELSLRYFLYKVRPENMYFSFVIPKKDGSSRKITAPRDELKTIQRKLSFILNAVYEPKVCAYGFINGKNHVLNAKQHSNKRLLFNIDLQDFFYQIHFGRIRGMFMKGPYFLTDEVATTIAQIACFNGRLPQGAPSSPVISNMIASPLDNALMRLAKKTGCIYTRYADDISFSTNKVSFDESIVCVVDNRILPGNELERIIDKNSFSVNPKKISLHTNSRRQEVTGLTVNEFPNLRRNYIRQLRAIIHGCKKFGIYNAAKVYVDKGLCKNAYISSIISDPSSEEKIVSWFKHVLVGKIHYIKQVKGGTSPTFFSYAQDINKLFDEEVFNLAPINDLHNRIKSNVFILEREDIPNNIYIQGSCFYIDGLGLFTCSHVTEDSNSYTVFSIDSYNDSPLGEISPDNLVSSDRKIDYALYSFNTNTDSNLFFKCGDSRSINIGDRVTIIGYPNYQKGNSPYIEECQITSTKKYLDAPFFTVNGRIVDGASGGLVLNANHEAIGIIKGGVCNFEDEATNENQGFIPLHLAIDHMEKNTRA